MIPVHTRSQLLTSLWTALRRLQQLNRQSGIRITPELGIREAFFLLYVDLHPGCAIVDARSFHRFHQSVGWVLVKELSRKKLISLGAGTSDGRSRSLRITNAGRKYLNQFDKLQNRHVNNYVRNLSTRESARWEKYLSVLADGLAVSPQQHRKGEHPLRVQMRRAFIAVGFLEADFVASGLTLVQYQLLAQLEITPQMSDASSIARTIGVEPAGVVFNVAALKRKGLIASVGSAMDRRKKVLTLTAKGIATLKAINKKVEGTLSRGLAHLEDRELKEFVRILERATGSGDYSPEISAIKVQLANSDREFFLARAFLVELLVRHKQHYDLSDELLPRSNRVVLALREQTPVALAEFHRQSGKWKLHRSMTDPREVSNILGLRFIERAAELVV